MQSSGSFCEGYIVKSKIPQILFLTFIVLFASAVSLMAESGGVVPAENDTVLMFVGEDLEVLSIASRREEGVWQAPAVAEVITRKDLWEQGVRTLSQGLGDDPGVSTWHRRKGARKLILGEFPILLCSSMIP